MSLVAKEKDMMVVKEVTPTPAQSVVTVMTAQADSTTTCECVYGCVIEAYICKCVYCVQCVRMWRVWLKKTLKRQTLK